MIMIRSNSAQRVGKPPPPVPPRPSKSAVAEAIAKSRKLDVLNDVSKAKSPTRQAPPPPSSPTAAVNEIVKSKSSYTVNVVLKKPLVYERSISEESKNSSRPVIYQSNVKCTSNNNNNKVQITRKDSDIKIINRVESFRNKDGVQVIRRDSVKKTEDVRHRVQISRRDSEKRDSFSGEKYVAKYGDVEVALKEKVNRERVQSATRENSKSDTTKSEDSSKKSAEITYESNSSQNSLDKKNWDNMLNDRNHVNTLIDEMFASVLEVHFNDEETDQTQIATNETNGLLQDKNKIIINNAGDSVQDNIKIENGPVVNHNNGCQIEENIVPKTVIVIKNDESDKDEQKDVKKENQSTSSSNTNSAERAKQVTFKDQLNHEHLINELQCMKKDQEKILKRQRKPSMHIYDNVEMSNSELATKTERPDWSHVDGEGGETKINCCQITINDLGDKEDKKVTNLDYERIIKMSSLHGLPPLPKSLSGFNLLENHQSGIANPPLRSSSIRSSGQQMPPGHLVYPPHPKVNGSGPDVNLPQLSGSTGKKSTNLDAQLAILRREMYSLRQLDLSLLSQLWSLNESIQDFRQILQDQEDRVLSPPSPSPTPSSGDDVDGDEFYMSASSLNFRPAPPPPPGARRPSSSSNGSSLG